MQDTSFTVDQIAELRRIEEARLRRGEPGLGSDLAALIARLTSGGVAPGAQPRGGNGPRLVSHDPRIIRQAKRLWDKGWGTAISIPTFYEYLTTIPQIPTFPTGYDGRFPHLVLVDQRIQVVEACQMLNVDFSGDSNTFVSHDETKSIKAPVYWMRCQNGKSHRGHKPSTCQTQFAAAGDEISLEVREGLALYAQFPDLLETNTSWDLLGSDRTDDRDMYTCLRRFPDGFVGLRRYLGDAAHPRCGSASRGIVPADHDQ